MLYRFAEFAFDDERLALSRSDQPVPLEPKPLALLLHLLRRHPTVVDHDELLEAVWPDAAVTRSSVTRAVRGLRRALGERHESGSVVRSLRGRGYGIAVEVLREGNVALRAGGGGPAPAGVFVGRDEPMQILSDCLARASARRGSVATIVGEPGIGKTRLLAALAERAEVAGWTVLGGHCPKERGAPALWPWVQILREAASKLRVDAIEEAMGVRAAELLRVEPTLLPPDRSRPLRAAMPDDSEQRFRLVDAAESFLAALASKKPLLVSIDDLQWADATSLELFAHLARGASGRSMLLVACHRDPDPSDALAEVLERIAALPGARSPIRLGGLGAEHLAELAEDVAGASLDADQRSKLHDLSGGNPFFAIELLRSGSVAATGDAPEEDAMSRPSEVPERIRAAVRARIDDLSEPAQSLLRAAAVAGAELTLPLLARTLETTEAELLDPIQESEAAHLLLEDPDQPGRFRFVHALVPEALYEGLSRRQRLQLHGRVARALEELHGANPGSHAAALAHHWELAAAAGDRAKAVEYARRAGERAFEQLAFAEAAAHYQHAVDWLAGSAAGTDAELAGLWIALARAHHNGGQPESAERAAWEAMALAESVGSPELIADAAWRLTAGQYRGQRVERLTRILEDAIASEEGLTNGGDPRTRSRLWGTLARILTYGAPFERVDDSSARALALAEEAGDPLVELRAIAARDLILASEARYEERAALSRDRVRLAVELGHRLEEFQARVYRVQRLIQEIEPDRIDDEISVLEQLASELAHSRRCEAFVLDLKALRAIWQGELDVAAALIPRIQDAWAQVDPLYGLMSVGAKSQLIAEVSGDWEAIDANEVMRASGKAQYALPKPYHCGLALRRFDMGREADAREDFAFLSRRDYDDVQRDATYLITLGLLAQLAHELDERTRVRKLESLLEPFAGRYASGHSAAVRGVVDRYRALLVWTRGDLDGADALLEVAIAQERHMRARPWEALARIDRARLLLARGAAGDADRAAEELRLVDEVCRGLAVAGITDRAEPLRRQLAKL